jgi:hypothetical protein
MKNIQIKVFDDPASDTTALVNAFLLTLEDSQVKHVNSFRNPVGNMMAPEGLVMYVVAYLK